MVYIFKINRVGPHLFLHKSHTLLALATLPHINTSDMKLTTITIPAIAFAATSTLAGPVAWGTCRTACHTGYGICCASAGTVAGKSGFVSTLSILRLPTLLLTLEVSCLG